MISIVPYKASWPQEFLEKGTMLRHILGDLALRIDHIGSTAVLGLAAKDVIDIQITAERLTSQLERVMNLAGFQRLINIHRDHVPPGKESTANEWQKWLFQPVSPGRRVNVHVRMPGRANQRYAILFRDYLRAFPAIAQAYGQVKEAIVKYHPEQDMEAYYDIKDPVCDIIIGGAEEWAAFINWQPGPSDC
ncbi:MAG TPA: GrpB family protein [Anaerolineales bacterium]|nr:GrpB family protein [Anaerolineales bacterium]